MGETIRVCGPVAFAGPIGLTPTAAGIILGGGPVDAANAFADDWRFKVVFLDYNDEFPEDIERAFGGKEVCVAGTIILAMAGGTEILPTNGSQIVVSGEGVATMPVGEVRRLPQGAVSYAEARNHVGSRATVCGVAVAFRASVPRNDTLNTQFDIPEAVLRQYPRGIELFADERTRHRIVVGDFSRFEIYIPVESGHWLPERDLKAHFVNREVCAHGPVQYTPAAGASITVESPDSIWFLDERPE